MKRNLLFLLATLAGIALTACGGRQTTPAACSVEATIGFPEYTRGYLKGADGKRLDTLAVNGGRLEFVRTDSLDMPYVAFIHLSNPQDSTDWLEMPIVVEGGKVKVSISEYISTEGTPLNQRMQAFLDDLQGTKDGVDVSKMTAEEIGKTFSEFYRQQILSNQDNVLGQFIYRNYGLHLTDTDRELVKAQLGN